MSSLQKKVEEFLAHTPIAVAGVSRQADQAANLIYRKFKDHGYPVYPTNPKAEIVEGDLCFPDLKSIPEQVEGVVIATTPAAAEEIVRECAQIGIRRVWLHRSFGEGSVSTSAVDYCQEHGISVIDGGCPMMFIEPDFGHRCMKWILGAMGKMPSGN